MLTRLLSCAVLAGTALCLTSSVHAQEYVKDFWGHPQSDTPPGSRMHCKYGKAWPVDPRPCGPSEPFIHRYHTAHYWPHPYRWDDRNDVRCILAMQKNNGWITATTLYDQHFDPATQQLNDSGRSHLRWILLYTPPQRRTTWVQAGENAATSQARMAAVQSEVTNVVGSDAPPVMLRVCQAQGWSAQEADLVRRSYLGSMPQPRLAVTQLSGAAGSGGGSSGGGGGGSGGQ
jgi:hypothetical protein